MKRLQFPCQFTCLVILYCSSVVFCGSSTLLLFNETENHPNEIRDLRNHSNSIAFDTDKILKRNKRFLLFSGAGISKIVLGFLAPVETRDRVNWRTLNLAYNYQWQYIPIPNVKSLWQTFAGDLRRQRQLYDEQGVYSRDLTRYLIYGAMELFLDAKGKPGRQCLLKSICDAAEHQIVRSGVFDEIVHLILTPNKDENIDDDYKNARFAGERGEECAQIYRCAYGDGFLDKFSFLA